MTPTESLRDRLRRLLDEKIPDGGADTDTRFLDAELDELLQEATTIHAAASAGWVEKAARYQSEMAGIEQIGTGQESYRLTSLKDRLEYALKMAKTYADIASAETGGSRILKVARPEVL